MTPGASSVTEADRSLAAAAAAGIHCISLPTPFLVGRVNCFLIEDDPLTLVDTGPNSGKTLDELEQALDGHGRRIEDLGLIILTHQHMDHLGLLEILARRSGAEVAAIDLLGPYLENFDASAVADDRFAMRVMLRHGVPSELATALGAVGAAFRSFGSSGRVTRPLRDGDELALRDRTLTIGHRPGHSPSDTIFFDAQRQMLIAGDHLLANISSNPLVSRRLTASGEPQAGAGDGAGATDGSGAGGADAAVGEDEERPHALEQYIGSMLATRAMPVALTLTGHGPPVTGHTELIDERLRMHERRAAKLRRMLEPAPATAFELASRMWGNVAVTQAFLTISEVLGHLDLLIASGQAAEDADGPVTRFSAL